MNILKAKILPFFRTLEASTVLPIHVDLLIFIPHIVCVPMYSNVLNLRYASIYVGVRAVQKVFGGNYA